MTIAVVGAGPTGLAAAWHLERHGQDVVVLEATDHVGGTAGSRAVGGQQVDVGLGRFGGDMPAEVRSELEALAGFEPATGRDLVRLGERWIPFPPEGSLRRALPLRAAARSVLDSLVASVRRAPAGATTFAEAVRAGVGPTVAARLHEPLARKIWGEEPEHLSAILASPLIAEASTAQHRRPIGGTGALVDDIADRIDDIRTGTRVVSLADSTDASGGVRIGLAGGETLRVDHVLSTMGLAKTAAMLGLVRPSQVDVEHRALVVVLLLTDATDADGDVHLLPDPRLLPWRVSETSVNTGDASDGRGVLRRAEVLCTVGDDVWNAADDVLGPRVADDLVRAGLPDPGRATVVTARFPAVYPVRTPESADALATAASALTRAPNVTVIGRQDRSPFDPDHVPFGAGFSSAGRHV